MKNLYEIKDIRGIHLCYQVASNERDAIETAKMYGHRRAHRAVFIRVDRY